MIQRSVATGKTRTLPCSGWILVFAAMAFACPAVVEVSAIERTASVYHSYEFKPIVDTPPPEGFRPFYISHYGRHGSRRLSGSAVSDVIGALERANKRNALTEAGRALLVDARKIAAVHHDMKGQLAERGAQEHRLLARRMADRFPDVFSHPRRVHCRSSVSPRVLTSQANFTMALKDAAPQLEFDFATGERHHKIINPLHWARMDRPDISTRTEKLSESFAKKWIDPKPLVGRIFAAGGGPKDPLKFARALFECASICQCCRCELDGMDIYRFFEAGEIAALSRSLSASHYMGMGNSEEFGEFVSASEVKLARDMAARADAAIADDSTAADLRFGHDSGLWPLAGFMGFEGPGDRVRAEDSPARCPSWKWMPMGCNFQMILYRNAKGEILVKFLWNEQEMRVRGVEPAAGPYYRWSDIRPRMEGWASVRAESVASMCAAKPIWPAGLEKEWNCQVGFTAEFDGAAAKDAVLRYTGATMCRVFLNGEFLGYGPARAAHGFVRVEELPLAGKVRPGRNVIAIEVAGYNCDSFYTVRQASFLQAEIVAGDGKVLAATDAKDGAFKAGVLEERVRKVQRFSFQRTFSEAYEVWPHCNEWRMGVKPPFAKPCALAEQPQLPLLPRIVPVPDYAILPAKTLVATGTVKYDESLPVKTPRSMTCTEGKSWRRDGWKVSELEWIPYYDMQRTIVKSRKESGAPCPAEIVVPGNGFALVDFGFLAAGFPKMTVVCDGPGTLYFCFDEVLENGDFSMKRFGSCDNIVAWRLKEAGTYDLEAFEPYAFRYGKLVFFGGKCRVSGLSVREYVNPEAGKAKFDSSDPDINKIFEAARRTFAENAVDGFMDCPSRERAGWNCDAFFTGRASIEFTGNAKEENIFIQNFLLPEKFNDIPDGMLPQCYPADFPDHSMIPNWAMWFVLELDEYYARTGDRAMVDAFRPRILKLMDFFWKCRNEEGLLEKLPPSVFVEWSRSNALVRDVNYPTNMTWARVLEVVARLYGIAEYAQEAERVRTTVRRQSWNGTFFVDRALRQKDGTLKPDTEATETCQYYAFFFDVATPTSHPELWKRLVEDFGPNRKKNNRWPAVAFSNAFIGNYLRFECLSKAGLSAKILEEAKGYFAFMAERTGTLWEHDAPTASCSHGFASHIAHVFYRDVLGVKEIDRVNKTVTIRIPDVPLERCAGEIPVDGGVVKVSWRREGAKMLKECSVPDGYTADVRSE